MLARCLMRMTATELHVRISQGIESFTKELRDVAAHRRGKKVTPSESDSWARSILTVVQPLVDAGLGGVEVLVEMRHPLTTASMDLVLVGSHPRSGERSVVVVENKQWDRAEPVEGTELVAHPGPGRLHPANQVWNYCRALTSYLTVLHDARVYGVVNLHRALSKDFAGILPQIQGLDDEVCQNVRMFGEDQRADFARFLTAVLSPIDAAEHADDVLRSPVRSTPKLMRAVAQVVKERSIFPLVDEQREAFDEVLARVTRHGHRSRKEVLAVLGGPGTGKSVIALELLGRLNRLGIESIHATGSKAFTTTLRECLAATKKEAKEVFAYFNNFGHLEPNSFRVLLADEAHRIRKSSNTRFTPKDRKSQIAQVEELIHAAWVPMFLLDERQQVRNGEVGTYDLIREAARELGYGVTVVKLRHQFRCGTSPEYIDWVEDLFYRQPRAWEPFEQFDVRLADSPQVMEDYLKSRVDEGHSARIAAGFCWPWNTPASDGTLPNDVVIGDWARPWNAKSERRLKNGIPPSDLWATDPQGFGQIGCIYTAQCFDYDYAGVIIGPDLIWREGAWLADSKANHDGKARGADFPAWARNTYRVLATRGIRGVVLQSTDRQTQAMLASLGIPRLTHR